MTKKLSIALLLAIGLICAAKAQESPTPISSPTPEESPSLSPTPSPVTDESPSPTPSASPAHGARLRFIPPPMEGTISLGIFDENRTLVRILQREAKIDNFSVEPDGLGATWDGKNDAGKDLPPGKYRGRGYRIGELKVEDVGKAKKAPANDGADRVAVTLVTNPLSSDTRAVVDLGVGVDSQGCFLRTMDGLPLFTVSKTPKLVRAAITKNGKKSVDVWQDDGEAVEQLRVSNIDQMMAFDCGFFELR
ncbi:MAG: hypothetical protein ABI925_08685 [Verrucomicrobiota bacterium]